MAGEAVLGASMGSRTVQVSMGLALYLGGHEDPHLGGPAACLPATPRWALCLEGLSQGRGLPKATTREGPAGPGICLLMNAPIRGSG